MHIVIKNQLLAGKSRIKMLYTWIANQMWDPVKILILSSSCSKILKKNQNDQRINLLYFRMKQIRWFFWIHVNFFNIFLHFLNSRFGNLSMTIATKTSKICDLKKLSKNKFMEKFIRIKKINKFISNEKIVIIY